MTARQRSVRQQLLLHHLVVACCGEEQKNTCHVSFSVPHLRPETAVQTPAAQVRDQSLVWVVFDTGAQPQKGGSCSSRGTLGLRQSVMVGFQASELLEEGVT